MRHIRFRSVSFALSASLLCGAMTMIFGCLWVLSAASQDVKISNQPASEGRQITPAGILLSDATTRLPAVAPLTVDFVRSPDKDGPDGKGRYLIAVNSGFGLQFNAGGNHGQQSLAVIDLIAKPAPVVIQNVYFPAPQSANVGVAVAARAEQDGGHLLYVSGGVENKIWMFRFTSGSRAPISPASPGPNTRVEAPFIDVNGFAAQAPTPRYNGNFAPVYPTGLALSPDGETLFVANNLGDSLGIIRDARGTRELVRVDLRRDNPLQPIYPYGVAVLPAPDGKAAKVYVSCWNDAAIAVIDPTNPTNPVRRVAVDRHPTSMIFNAAKTRLYVVNSNADSVSVIETAADREIERVNTRLAEKALPGGSPESLSLSADEKTLFVANAHSNAVAVIALAQSGEEKSRLNGFIPTGQYPAAVAVVGQNLIVGNGKGTGVENSSVVVNNSGRAPNAPNDRFPAGRGQGGQYSGSLISGNLSLIDIPGERQLYGFTQQVLRNNGLIGDVKSRLFAGANPIKHVIYVIKENRTYDQVFGDLAQSGDGSKADGEPSLAIFGGGEAARSPGGSAQNVSPNHRALAQRFGLLDRFFVNSEASADGHNWSTAAFSTDYVDKAYRWEYSGRGRTYDYEGFNRLPNLDPVDGLPSFFAKPVTADEVITFQKRYAPDINGARDVAEPETLYLWDAAKRASLSYRLYGEFVPTLSEADLKAINTNRPKPYPDLTPTVRAFATKRSIEGHFSATFRNFDLNTPDSMTIDSYRASRESQGRVDPVITNNHADARFRGYSRLGDWLDEFRGYVSDLGAGRPDRMPNLTIMRFPNDHTEGMRVGHPTPQFFVAENDYAIGKLVEAVSRSPYWRDTAIFILEDDSQDGPDHVDMHRSPAFVVSAYNRPGALIHEYHNTVSLIRTMEILLGLPPMNQLDAAAAPIDVFRDEADLRPYQAVAPDVALDNLIVAPARDARTAYWMKRSQEQNLAKPDQADADTLNRVIWFSARGDSYPEHRIAHLPAFDLMLVGLRREEDENEKEERLERRRGARARRAFVARRQPAK
ncbi:MAG TPA: bifunctional YncE family protein/alkaline phosphatase family protein [Blastocatellia bacterium]|nr:bifunctional YncE family protein/alkaline phosphatase family protein [Blastocatellia bacterium]